MYSGCWMGVVSIFWAFCIGWTVFAMSCVSVFRSWHVGAIHYMPSAHFRKAKWWHNASLIWRRWPQLCSRVLLTNIDTLTVCVLTGFSFGGHLLLSVHCTWLFNTFMIETRFQDADGHLWLRHRVSHGDWLNVMSLLPYSRLTLAFGNGMTYCPIFSYWVIGQLPASAAVASCVLVSCDFHGLLRR